MALVIQKSAMMTLQFEPDSALNDLSILCIFRQQRQIELAAETAAQNMISIHWERFILSVPDTKPPHPSAVIYYCTNSR